MRKTISLLALAYLSPLWLFGQSPTGGTLPTLAHTPDPNWNTSTLLFDDEFPGTTLNTTNWAYHGVPGSFSYMCFENSNVSINPSITTPSGDNHALQITTTWGASNSCGTPITTGWVYSNPQYKYGYFEASCEMAGSGGSRPWGGYNFAFWLYEGCQSSCVGWPINDESTYTNELDCEILTADATGWTQDFTHTIHMSQPGSCYNTQSVWGNYSPYSDMGGQFNTSSFNPTTSFHKYAVEWTPDHIIYFFDDVAIQMEHNSPSPLLDPSFVNGGIPQNAQSLNLDVFVGSEDATVTYPGHMYVDYVHAYKLNNSGCSTTLYNSGTSSAFNPLAFNQVYKNITIGSYSGNTSVLSSSTTVIMRAANNTIIYGPFKVPTPTNGAFVILPTACY
jgi:beta-glucanase (GH16 family)